MLIFLELLFVGSFLDGCREELPLDLWFAKVIDQVAYDFEVSLELLRL